MIEFRILGPLEVAGDAGPITLGGQKQRALLGPLLDARRRGRSHRTGLSTSSGARNRRRPPRRPSRISSLTFRKLLGTDAPCDATSRLRAADRRREPRPGPVRASRRRKPGPRRPSEDRAAKLREALALWRGAPLADLAFEDRSPRTRSGDSRNCAWRRSRSGSTQTSSSGRVRASSPSWRRSSLGLPLARAATWRS